MSNKTAYMTRLAQFQGRMNQLVAQDIYEHGEAQEDREATFQDMKRSCAELGRMAFDLYTSVCKIEETVAAAFIIASGVEADGEPGNGQEE